MKVKRRAIPVDDGEHFGSDVDPARIAGRLAGFDESGGAALAHDPFACRSYACQHLFANELDIGPQPLTHQLHFAPGIVPVCLERFQTGLERRIREIYAHHREPDGEGVHRIWGDFSAGGDEAERIAARWSELAPKSGYAALASAEVLRGRGWDARGTRRIGDTPPEAIRAMDAYFAKARAGFRRAIELQPDLLDAYIGLVDIGRSDGDGAAEAFARAQALDPGCGELAFRHMQGLQPRWGGSQMAMLSYAGELRPLVSARPLLANQQSTPLSDYVGWSADDRYAPESLDVLDEAVRLSGEEASLRAASDARRRIAGPRRDVPRAVAEQLQLGRFGEREAWGDRLVAQYLVRRDPTWARRVMAHGVALDPGDTFGRYLLGAANYNAGAYDEAERQYLLAAEGDDERRDALRELSAMWLYDAGLPPAAAAVRAEPFVDRLLAAFPDDGRGLFMRMHVHSMRDPRHAIAPGDLQAFLDHADRDDPWQRWRLEHLRQAMPARTPAAAAKPARR